MKASEPHGHGNGGGGRQNLFGAVCIIHALGAVRITNTVCPAKTFMLASQKAEGMGGHVQHVAGLGVNQLQMASPSTPSRVTHGIR